MIDPEDQQAVNLAMGRLFQIMSRPHKPGDLNDYEDCRRVILDLCEPIPYYRPCVVRQRGQGAAGD